MNGVEILIGLVTAALASGGGWWASGRYSKKKEVNEDLTLSGYKARAKVRVAQLDQEIENVQKQQTECVELLKLLTAERDAWQQPPV